jgi:hypothetical protein
MKASDLSHWTRNGEERNVNTMGGPIIIWPPDVCSDFPGCYSGKRDVGGLLLELFLGLFL